MMPSAELPTIAASRAWVAASRRRRRRPRALALTSAASNRLTRLPARNRMRGEGWCRRWTNSGSALNAICQCRP